MGILRKYLNTFVKLIIFLGLGYVLYTQVFFNIDVKESLSTLRVNLLEGRGWFVMALILTVFNWSVETVKWRFLVNKISAIG
ncbi:MAG TPA: hypothetical protein VFD65_03080, partial [Chitinophagales bacterium]|nr:hypothetical protein [Chitinophagales bacterium]